MNHNRSGTVVTFCSLRRRHNSGLTINLYNPEICLYNHGDLKIFEMIINGLVSFFRII